MNVGVRMAQRGPVDGRLRLLILLLVGFGLAMVYSASNALSVVHFDKSSVYFTSQLIKAVLGLGVMWAAAWVDYRLWARIAKPLLWVSVGLLLVLAVPLPSTFVPEVNGARRWLALPGFTFQPLELAKLALIVWMAATISRKGAKLDRASDGLVPLLVMPLVLAGLVVLQPDFKGAFLLLLLAMVLLFLGGVRMAYLVRIAAGAIPVAALIMISEPYRLRRLMAFFDRSEDVQGISYQINQSLISLGSGGWFGVGLGSSKQKFAFLPMAHTDFIISIVGEELGLPGTLGVLAAFLYFGALGYRIARRAPDAFGFLLASGVTTLILVSALLNLGVATASLPTTGLTLPFISYGGTALIVQLAAAGILLSISREAVDVPSPPEGGAGRKLSRRWPSLRRFGRRPHDAR
ncbi:MAG: putative lipid II flippase FtsW [Gemmatimonadota bacterium]